MANLAKKPEAFGEPQYWSKLEVNFFNFFIYYSSFFYSLNTHQVSIIGNIINGLPSADIHRMSNDKLQLNHFYKAANRIPTESRKLNVPVNRNTIQANATNTNDTEK